MCLISRTRETATALQAGRYVCLHFWCFFIQCVCQSFSVRRYGVTVVGSQGLHCALCCFYLLWYHCDIPPGILASLWLFNSQFIVTIILFVCRHHSWLSPSPAGTHIICTGSLLLCMHVALMQPRPPFIVTHPLHSNPVNWPIATMTFDSHLTSPCSM